MSWKPQAKTKTMLDKLASRINGEHVACERALKDGLQHAVEAGKLLIEAKTQHKHGGWLKWLEANFASTPRTAQGYMWLSKRMLDEAKAKQVSHLGLRAAVSQLRRDDREEQRDQERAANEERIKQLEDNQATLARREPVVTEEKVGPAGWLHRVTRNGVGATRECIDPEYLELKNTEIDDDLRHVIWNAIEGLSVAQQGLGDLEEYCRHHGTVREDLHTVSGWEGVEYPCAEILERWRELSESVNAAFGLAETCEV